MREQIAVALVCGLTMAACGTSTVAPNQTAPSVEASTPGPTQSAPAAGSCEQLERELLAARDYRNKQVQIFGPSDAAEQAGEQVRVAEQKATQAGCEIENAKLLEKYSP